MKKKDIKARLRESIMGQMREAEPKQTQEPSKKDEKSYDKEYVEVQNKLSGTMLKQSQVMAAAGLGDPKDATDRSLFSKKVRKDKNDQGGTYMFDEKELASVVKVLNNPAAYLSIKKGHN